MIIPDPVIMENENGRLFEFELGRIEKFKVDNPENPDQELFEERYVQYKFNQSKEQMVILFSKYMQTEQITSKEGIVHIKDLEYKTNEIFKGGSYEICVRDITKSVENKMSEVKIELVIIDPEEIAAQAQAAAQAKPGPGKKK